MANPKEVLDNLNATLRRLEQSELDMEKRIEALTSSQRPPRPASERGALTKYSVYGSAKDLRASQSQSFVDINSDAAPSLPSPTTKYHRESVDSVMSAGSSVSALSDSGGLLEIMNSWEFIVDFVGTQVGSRIVGVKEERLLIIDINSQTWTEADQTTLVPIVVRKLANIVSTTINHGNLIRTEWRIVGGVEVTYYKVSSLDEAEEITNILLPGDATTISHLHVQVRINKAAEGNVQTCSYCFERYIATLSSNRKNIKGKPTCPDCVDLHSGLTPDEMILAETFNYNSIREPTEFAPASEANSIKIIKGVKVTVYEDYYCMERKVTMREVEPPLSPLLAFQRSNSVVSRPNLRPNTSITEDDLMVGDHLLIYFRKFVIPEASWSLAVTEHILKIHKIPMSRSVQSSKGEVQWNAILLFTDFHIFIFEDDGSSKSFSSRPKFPISDRKPLPYLSNIIIGPEGEWIRFEFSKDGDSIENWAIMTRGHKRCQEIMASVKKAVPLEKLKVQEFDEPFLGHLNCMFESEEESLRLYITVKQVMPNNTYTPRTIVVSSHRVYVCDEDYTGNRFGGKVHIKRSHSNLTADWNESDCKVKVISSPELSPGSMVVKLRFKKYLGGSEKGKWNFIVESRNVQQALFNVLKSLLASK